MANLCLADMGLQRMSLKLGRTLVPGGNFRINKYSVAHLAQTVANPEVYRQIVTVHHAHLEHAAMHPIHRMCLTISGIAQYCSLPQRCRRCLDIGS